MWFDALYDPYRLHAANAEGRRFPGRFQDRLRYQCPLKIPRIFISIPRLFKGSGIFVFSGESMDIADSDTTYFYLFLARNSLSNGSIGKPGDILYFYGGQIYGIDAQGKEIADLLDPAWSQSLEHIPFIRFDGKVEAGRNEAGNV